MTSNRSILFTIEHEGVICKSDAGLYRERYDKQVQFLSIYGAPQQTKAIFSALAASKELLIGEDAFRRTRDALRFRGYSLGYGKHHGIIWTDQLDVSLIVWSSDEEKRSRLRNILSRRRIPYDPQHFSRLEKLLIDHGYLLALDGWGSIGGYACDFDDDAICDLIIAEIYRSKTRKVA